jgi:CBS domain-containing protein
MPQTVREVMSANRVTLSRNSSVMEAARAMREKDIGDVVVMDNGNLYGIATDRDLVVRGLAEGKDPQKTSLEEVCSREPMTLSPDDKVAEAVELMRNKAIRRVPDISAAKPNN